eukprot:gene10899-biopygen3066
MNSCHEEGVRDRNRANRSTGSTASIPGRFRSRTPSSDLLARGPKLHEQVKEKLHVWHGVLSWAGDALFMAFDEPDWQNRPSLYFPGSEDSISIGVQKD